MKTLTPRKRIVAGVALAATVCGIASMAPATASAAPAYGATYRQLIGHVTGPTYLEASTPSAGTYAVEYDVTGVSYWDTYINGTELGYVGGVAGTYYTRDVSLNGGGQLVQVTGPEGTGEADVYLVSVP